MASPVGTEGRSILKPNLGNAIPEVSEFYNNKSMPEIIMTETAIKGTIWAEFIGNNLFKEND